MSASLKESVPPTGIDVRFDDEPAGFSQRDQDFVRLLNAAGIAAELDDTTLGAIAAALPEAQIDTRRMDLLEHYYRGNDDASVASRRRNSDRFFVHHDHFEVNAHQIVAALSSLNDEVATVELQRIGGEQGPLVLRAGEHFSAIADEKDDTDERGTVAVRALVRAMNALLAKAGVERRLVPLIPDDTRELYVGVSEDGAITLLEGACTEISAVQALREFASW